MKITTNDKILAYLALLSGLTISAVAIYYSVAGLVAIFAAAAVPIIVMGVALELSKLVATVWLKLNWQRAPIFIRTYLLIAIIILMVITSMGIFGFLSKAHSDNSLVSGDVQSKIAIYDDKIKTQKENIEANRKALKQMDEGVDQVLGRSTDEKGADKAVAMRRSQQKERGRLQAEISQSQKSIAELNDARAPIAAEVRKVEAEVGPIKYIAAFVYGDNPDANVLEKAVTWVIIIIVSVFDPLAVILLLASQYSFQWFRQEREKQEEEKFELPDSLYIPDPEEEKFQESLVAQNDSKYEPDNGSLTDDQIDQINTMLAEAVVIEEPTHTEEIPPTPSTALGGDITAPEETVEDITSIDQWNELIAEADATVAAEEQDEEAILNSVEESEKHAMTQWKAKHPSSSLKLQRRLFEKGAIKELPWVNYINTDAEEARKWAEENPETAEAKTAKEWAEEITYIENVEGTQVRKVLEGYQQNAEQGKDTLWQRIKKGD
jgi:hypothetical protein